MQHAGLRAFVGKLSMDISSRESYVESSSSSSLASASSFVQRCHQLVQDLPAHRRLVEPVLTPRFVPTCSNELLKGLGKLSKDQSLRIQSHLAEAEDQVKWVRGERGMEDIDVFSQVRFWQELGKRMMMLILPMPYRQTCSLHAPSKHTVPTSTHPTWTSCTRPEPPLRIAHSPMYTFRRVRLNSARLCRRKSQSDLERTLREGIVWISCLP